MLNQGGRGVSNVAQAVRLRHPLADDDEARRALGGILQILSRLLDRDVERHGVGRRRFQAIDAVREHATCVIREAAADGDNRNTVLARGRGDTRRRLAEGGLEVDAPLAGDGEIGALHDLLEARCRDDELDAALQRRVGEGHEAGADATAGSGTGPIDDVGADAAFDDVGEVREVLVEQLDHFRCGALLRTVDARGALLSAQRIGDVAGDADVDRGASPG